ncbi:MAG TPA: hypothetical protein VMG59_09005 [Phycisphaerae bacterium]|nr:hypothetical protein [Phycisphaerae bacterium]
MSSNRREVSTAAELIAAARDASVGRIVISADLTGVPALRLSPGQTLTASDLNKTIRFADGQDGIQLSANNTVENLQLITTPDKRVLFNDTTVDDFGRFDLRNVKLTGVTLLLAADRIRAGHVDAHNIDIVSADARWYNVRPKGYGVEVIPGAFTLWNQQLDSAVTITADLTALRAGRPKAPVFGSGIFVGGAGDTGGKLVVHRLETLGVYSQGGIAQGTPDRISGGVFTVYGAFVDTVHTFGPVTTYGPNDMVLDNWGVVDRWISEEKITSHGPSGIGFVNFGTINLLQIKAPIETFGLGARGFNVYSGTVKSAEFERIVTHGDGAVGIQISQPVGDITVLRGIETFGGTGESLVKGVVTKLSAIALSMKPGGSVRKLDIAGGLTTHGPGIAPLELHGNVELLHITGGTSALGDRV